MLLRWRARHTILTNSRPPNRHPGPARSRKFAGPVQMTEAAPPSIGTMAPVM